MSGNAPLGGFIDLSPTNTPRLEAAGLPYRCGDVRQWWAHRRQPLLTATGAGRDRTGQAKNGPATPHGRALDAAARRLLAVTAGAEAPPADDRRGARPQLRADRLAGIKATASRRPTAGPDGLAIDPADSIH